MRILFRALLCLALAVSAPAAFAAGKSNYLEDKVLNWLTGSAMGSSPTVLCVGLWNGDPTDAGTGGTEVTSSVRAAGRVTATFGTITTAATANSKANTAAVDYGAAASGTTFSHFAIWDSCTVGSGNMLYSNPLAGGSQTVSPGTNVSFGVGSLAISEE